MIVLLNINLNVRKERKMVIKLWGVPTKLLISLLLIFLDYHTWYRLKAMSILLYSIAIMWNYPCFKFININLNIRNEKGNVEKLVGVYL